MNRATRRAKEKKKPVPKELTQILSALGPLQEVVELAQRIKPELEKIDQLMIQLEAANEALQKAEAENTALRNMLETQRQVFLRLFATGMDIPLDQVLSIEARLLNEVENARTPNSETAEISTSDSAADPSGRLEEVITPSNPEGREESRPES